MSRFVLLLAALASSTHAGEPGNKFSLAGLHVGMSQSAAKAVGLTDCRVGDKAGEQRESVYCTPKNAGVFAGLPVNEALVEFKGPKHTTLTKMRFTVGVGAAAATDSFTRAWGPASKNHYTLHWTDGPAELSLYTRLAHSKASVTITHDPERARRQAKAAAIERAAKTKDVETLKAFK